jgi:hypothetical protein
MYKDYLTDIAFTQEADTCPALLHDAFSSHRLPDFRPRPAPVAVEVPEPKRRRKIKAPRPSAKEWYQRPYIRVNGRKLKRSFVIPFPLYRHLSDTDRCARLRGRPFSHVLTIKPRVMDAMAPELRLQFWQDLIDNLGRPFRREHLTFSYACSRESNAVLRNGTGEHLHLIGHFPPRLLKKVRKSLSRKFPGTEEVHVLTIQRAAFRLRNGRYGSPLGYCLKNLNPYLAEKSNTAWKRGGAILSTRVWCSRDLTPKAMDQWRQQYRV